MRKYINNEITLMQYIFLIHGIQIGTGVLQLPQILAEKAGMNGWIPLICGWALSSAASLIIIQVMKKHPQATLMDIMTTYFGKWIGKVSSILLLIYFSIVSFTLIQKSILFIQVWLLPGVPSYIIMFLFSVPTYIIARNGIRIIGRYAELAFFLVLWMPLFYIIALNQNHHWVHLLPLFKNIQQSLMATQSTIVSFLGFEVTFLFYPFLKEKKAAPLGIIIANSLSLLVFLFVTIACFVFFSPDEITHYYEPTLSMLKVVEFRFIERMEIIFLAFYLFILSTTWIPYIYSLAFCTTWLFNKGKSKNYLLLYLLFFILIMYFVVPTFPRNDSLMVFYQKIGTLFSYAFPVFLLIYSFIYYRIRGRITK
ncbi:GerAB/ArcD/ProY family transporter [Priestia aryabhattai]|uniref:GerAB/ArcD/ProY family transporter n=1 Tax=Priestia aryabhattai TaxID=412384 RepID=UPI0018734432|nr:endospore germination permease [Priestia aryabhattai]MBE5100303.1 endospore germination permease [Priestia aryabhattai]